MREHDYNNQVSSFRAPAERAVAQLKTWRILFTRLQETIEDLLVILSGRYRPVLAVSPQLGAIRAREPETSYGFLGEGIARVKISAFGAAQ